MQRGQNPEIEVSSSSISRSQGENSVNSKKQQLLTGNADRRRYVVLIFHNRMNEKVKVIRKMSLLLRVALVMITRRL